MATTEAVDISPKQDGGVLKQILREGEGEELPPQGCRVKVHYTGTLLDGTQFDSSRDRGQPFSFTLGKGSVIKAWDIGVATMRRGEQAILTCKPEYAYGSTGSPPTIPPDATLKFDVEVIDWKGEDLSPKKDGGIEKITIQSGEGYTTPNDGAIVEVHLIGKFENKVFDERDVSFTVGEGSEANIIEGVEKAVEKMKKGETARILIKPEYAFGAEGNSELQVPPNATVEYTVTLKQFERSKESWALDTEERLEQARLFHEKGANYIKAGKYNLAVKMYKKVFSFLEFEQDTKDLHAEEREKLLLKANLNNSLAYLNLNEPFEAEKAATSALKIDPNNEKALYRRGRALMIANEPQKAAEDFKKVLEINPSNKIAKENLVVCRNIMKDLLQKEKQVYANMFEKFAKKDTQVKDD